MNIGRVRGVHLGIAAKKPAEVPAPVFDSATEDDIIECLRWRA